MAQFDIATPSTVWLVPLSLLLLLVLLVRVLLLVLVLLLLLALVDVKEHGCRRQLLEIQDNLHCRGAARDGKGWVHYREDSLELCQGDQGVCQGQGKKGLLEGVFIPTVIRRVAAAPPRSCHPLKHARSPSPASQAAHTLAPVQPPAQPAPGCRCCWW